MEKTADSSVGLLDTYFDTILSDPIENSGWKNIDECLVAENICLEEDSVLSSINSVQRKSDGIFFTPIDLAKQSAIKIAHIASEGPILDPACGTGNLLVEVAKTLEVFSSLEETLVAWNNVIHGLDINKDFIDLAQKKIIRVALDKGARPKDSSKKCELTQLLSNIKVGDFLCEYESYAGLIKNIIMNPPFCYLRTPSSINWTSGQSNAAALFVFYAVGLLPVGGKILGILPDVLRSGTRYANWRCSLKSSLDYSIEPFGGFQKDVQVDVFVLFGTKNDQNILEDSPVSPASQNQGRVLGDYFDVGVGPVVPHRDKLIGPDSLYAHARILPPWSTVTSLPERITHPGKRFAPPFVAIRRTSSPKDKYRIMATLVNCDEPVAVENHIIVLSPKDKKNKTCKKLMKKLMSESINQYINLKIRCRHLTVGIIKNIPLDGMD